MVLLNRMFISKLGLAGIMIHFVLTAGCAQYSPTASNQADVNFTNPAQSPQKSDPQKSVEVLLTSLSSSDNAVQSAAEEELLKIAQSSSAGRETVIRELLNSVRRNPELDGSHARLSVATFTFWDSFTSLMWRLKATEAIDVMITCIHCSNGFSGRMGDPPAAFALFRMGSRAVPQLSDALQHEGNGYIKIQMVMCLSRIGGPKSKAALQKALAAEKDEDMRGYIRRAL